MWFVEFGRHVSKVQCLPLNYIIWETWEAEATAHRLMRTTSSRKARCTPFVWYGGDPSVSHIPGGAEENGGSKPP